MPNKNSFRLNQLYIVAILLFSSSFLINSLSAQTISVYATPIEKDVEGFDLDKQEYLYLEDGVANYDNGQWAAIKLEVESEFVPENNFIYLSYALLDTVELWIQGDNGQLKRVYQTGQAFNFASRPYASSDFVFPMVEGIETYYFKIYSSKPVILPFQILSTKELFRTLTAKDFLFGTYTGIILVMFLYNLVLFFITRDKSYAFYILYLITLVVTQLALFGYTDRFLMPDLPVLNQKFAVLSGALVAIASVFFGVNFLNLRNKAPLFAKLFFAVVILDIFGLIYLILDWDVLAFHWVNFASLYGSVIGLTAAIKLSRTGYKPAKFFLIAWSVFIVSVIIFALMNLDIIPYNPYLHGSMLFGSSIEAILLSVALADRINVLRKENEESQKKALEMARENARIIREQNIILEEKVQVRTKELQNSNKELRVTLDNLKATQTQLVQSEKMASLGILTAGVAHEINNPLNFIHGGYIAINEELNKENNHLDKNELKEYLRWIQSGAERATKIVKSLNIYSRTNEDFTEECNINSIIEDCISVLQHKIRSKIELNLQLTNEINSIKGNSGKLHQVILNLLINAIDSIENNGIIEVITKISNNIIIIIIEDNGCGISEENITKVLEPFYTTKAPGKGTGLGLSIVNSIIQEHKGNINYNSEVGKGTKVIVSLPKL